MRISILLTQVSPVTQAVSADLRQFLIHLDKLDLINNLNSIKLLAISEAFEKFPNESVDVD